MDFRKALETQDNNFESILEIMKLIKEPEKVNNIRNLLKTVNLILEYFMNREESELRIPIVYFPLCLEYAQELCEDFVTLKLGLYSNKIWKNHLCTSLSKDTLFVPSDVTTKKQKELLRENFRYEKKLSTILARSKDELVDYDRSLIYSDRLLKDYASYQEANSAYNRKSVNKYWYLRHAVNSTKNFLKDYYPLSIINTDSDSFYEYMIENEDGVKIQNIVVFPLKSPDGRYSQFCSDSFQKCYLDDFCDADCGLKNVFFFCFSRKPYKLRRLFDFKQRMKEKIQLFENQLYDFISFTYEESLTLCNSISNNHISLSLGKEHNDLQEDYENLFDELTNGLDRYVSRRNEMSLCTNGEECNQYFSKLLDETEADENILSQIFSINSKLWKEEIEYKLFHFVYNESVFVITGFDVSETLKSNFAHFLISQYQATKVKFGTFSELRGSSSI